MAQKTGVTNKNLLDILACPICRGNIRFNGKTIECSNDNCRHSFPVVNGVPQMNISESNLDSSLPRICSAQKLLQLSYRLAAASSWSIPAMRKRAKQQFSNMLSKGAGNVLHYLAEGWDFEEALQKRIAGFIDLLITPHELADIFILQWKDNLTKLLIRTRKEQGKFKKTGAMPSSFLPERLSEREQIIKEKLPKGGRILYVGCGTGRECFRYEKMGYEVVGIDTEAGLLDAMEDWCTLLNMQSMPVQMNVLFLGFLPHTFDAAIIEIYGAFPSKTQRLKLQQELARALKPGAFAFMVGNRFHYTTHMQLQNVWRDRTGKHQYLELLQDELLKPSPKEPNVEYDKNTDRLIYGVVRGSYTCDSLSSELSACFQVEKCFRAQDKRYLLGLVRPLPQDKWKIETVAEPKMISPSKEVISEADGFAREIEGLVDVLEKNAEATKEFVDKSAVLENEGWDRLKKILWKE
ncbi:MAG: methyltransferase domain-containing protein [Candidatus Saganbacteria bacterium]|nr:methyltransferase domain-containing protein [Candidatus Saganbacteria bacterium]